jgi:hypothetical protein
VPFVAVGARSFTCLLSVSLLGQLRAYCLCRSSGGYVPIVCVAARAVMRLLSVSQLGQLRAYCRCWSSGYYVPIVSVGARAVTCLLSVSQLGQLRAYCLCRSSGGHVPTVGARAVAYSRQLVATDLRVQYQVNPRVVCGGQYGTGGQVFVPHLIPHIPHAHLSPVTTTSLITSDKKQKMIRLNSARNWYFANCNSEMGLVGFSDIFTLLL